MAGGVGEVVEHLPRKCSNPSTKNKKCFVNFKGKANMITK
jgi:hypothetical protein